MNYEGCLDDRWMMEWAADLPWCVHTVQYIVRDLPNMIIKSIAFHPHSST